MTSYLPIYLIKIKSIKILNLSYLGTLYWLSTHYSIIKCSFISVTLDMLRNKKEKNVQTQGEKRREEKISTNKFSGALN